VAYFYPVYLSIILILLFISYSILILYYWQSWRSIPDFALSNPTQSIFISIIIPARNEEENIGGLLTALQQQTYPGELFEIIVVNDHSTDKTTEVVKQFPGVKLLELKDEIINSYKKKAIETGIAAASGELIVTTDADCIPPPSWLQTIASFKEKTNAGFIVAPVVFNCNSSPVQVFQAMDFMVLQGITGASVYKKIHSMCNGANLAYERKLFYEVNGFDGIDHIASGDDMLLMHKIAKKYPHRILYLKSTDVIVSTRPMPTWKQFFNQRIRWASKATHYDDKKIFLVLLLVYLFNISFLVLLVAGFWNSYFWLIFLTAWVLKTAVEFPFFYSLSQFFNKQWALKFFFFFQPLHIFYTIISGLLGQFGKYEWKGRKVN
jgi:cellulose synthase/poly-beta-1,6-N-acetylglucosamine synthase-like glycosyltransferase